MDDWKFEDLLGTFSEHDLWQEEQSATTRYLNDPGQLWFSFPWVLSEGPGGEGTFPDANKEAARYCDRMADAMELAPDEAAARRERFLAADSEALRTAIFWMAQLCGISCWHEDADESADMWDFLENDNGVAVKTTVGRLAKAMAFAHNSPARHAEPSVCAVGYVNQSSYFLEQDGFRSLLSIVSESWSYEKEVRAISKSPGLFDLPLSIKKEIELPMPNDGVMREDEKNNHIRKIGN